MNSATAEMIRSSEPAYKKARYSQYKASKSTGKYSPSAADFISSFYGVLKRWNSETAFTSDTSKITSHESFLALVANAESTLDLICSELRKQPSHLVFVLEEAFGDSPVTAEERGNIPAMTNAWLSWASNRGTCA